MNAVRALGARALTLAVSMVCGVLTTRLVLGEEGVGAYALYGLLVALPSLLAFTDLGSGAALVNSVSSSDDVRHDPLVRDQVTAVGRILVAFAAVIMVANAILLVTGTWGSLLGSVGRQPGAELAAFACLTVFCMGVPLGLWVRIMLGLRRNHIIILLQGLISPINLLFVWLLVHFAPSPHSMLALSSFVAAFLVTVVGLTLTWWSTRPLLRSALVRVPSWRRFPSVRVMDVGWPMLAQLLSFPIAVQTQRYILANMSTEHQVAEYGVVAQVFLALNGLVIAAGVALWPHFNVRRHRGELTGGPYRISAAFTAGAAAAGALLLAFSGPVFGFISNGELEVDKGTILAFAAMITALAALYPLGMFIMDTPGIRFQVIPTLAMAVSSVLLTVVLVPALGAAGPPLGTACAIVCCQVVPFVLYIRRHRDRLLSGGSSTSASVHSERVTAE